MAVPRDLLTFFIESNPPGPLTNSQKWRFSHFKLEKIRLSAVLVSADSKTFSACLSGAQVGSIHGEKKPKINKLMTALNFFFFGSLENHFSIGTY